MTKGWQVSAITLTPKVRQWLAAPTAVFLLHRFDQAVNLIDARGVIVSIVQPGIGAGPFSMVVEGERPFPAEMNSSTHIGKTADSLQIGPLRVDVRPARLWSPAPKWAMWRQSQRDWLSRVPPVETAVWHQVDRLNAGAPANFAPRFQSAAAAVVDAIASPNAPALETAVCQLAGLGPGLTPAGDDYLLGLLLGLWATQPEATVLALAKRLLGTAVPRTTPLSAAWLQAAAQGEAWLAWHNLLEALLAGGSWQEPFNRILNSGATSGIASLMGFVAALPAAKQAA